MIIAVPQLLFLSKSAVACKFQDLTQILGEQAHTCVFFNLECWFVLRSVHNMACKFQYLTQILGEQAHTLFFALECWCVFRARYVKCITAPSYCFLVGVVADYWRRNGGKIYIIYF